MRLLRISKNNVGMLLLIIGSAIYIFAHIQDANQPRKATSITGYASVIDGDSLRINGYEIRVHGIDVPEFEQTCEHANSEEWLPGREATVWLTKRLKEQRITCHFVEKDIYGRYVAYCSLENGQDLAYEMVAEGWAFPYRRFVGKLYDNPWQAAAHRGEGVHQGHCETPQKWRKENRKNK